MARAEAAAADGEDRRSTLLVAEIGGAVVGYAHVHWVPMVFLPGPKGYISELFVVEAARGHGRRDALLRAI